MRGTRNHSTSSDPNAPYYVMIRDAERKILRDAIEYNDGNVSAAAAMLGVSHTLVGKRARLLGGVLPEYPRREPFHYATAMKEIKHDYQKGKTRAKRADVHHPATQQVQREDRSADDERRSSADLDAQQDQPGDGAGIE